MTTNKFTSFGIACFHFGVQVTPPHVFRHDAYAKTIEEFLQSLDTVDQVSVELMSHNADAEYELSGKTAVTL